MFATVLWGASNSCPNGPGFTGSRLKAASQGGDRFTGRLPLGDAVCCKPAELLRGLAGLHAAGGLQRDIKPKNLLVNAANCELC